MKFKKQNGNALFFILIAIALLGLLTVTLSRSGGSSNDTGDYEQNQIAASEILSYAKSIENAVQLLIAKGCSENEISFENSVVAGYTNPNSPADKSCHVFDVAGAGMTYNAPYENWLDTSKSADSAYNNYSITGDSFVDGVYSTKTDLVMILPFLNKNFCAQINATLKIKNYTGVFPEDSNGINVGVAQYYKGTFGVTALNGIADTANSTSFAPRNTACLHETSGCTGGDCYIFYHVLHAR